MHKGQVNAPGDVIEQSNALSLLLVDSQALTREGMRAIVGKVNFLRVIAEATGGYAALMACRQRRVDMALIAQSLDDIDVVETCQSLMKHFPSLRLVVCYDRLDAREAAQLLQIGVCGLVSRDAPGTVMADALRAVAGGGTFVPVSVSRVLFRPQTSVASIASGNLTPREAEVLRLVALGFSNKDVANRLNLSVRTVETHRFNVRQKTGASRVRELQRLARRLGLLDAIEEPEDVGAGAPVLATMAAAAVFAMGLAGSGATPARAAAPERAEMRIEVIDQDLGGLLAEFAKSHGLRAEIAPDLRQRVSHETLPADAKSFLSRINKEFDVVAHIEGDALVATSRSADVTRLMPLGDVAFATVEPLLRQAGVPLAAVTLSYAKDSNALVAVGPASAVGEIAALVERARAHIGAGPTIMRYGVIQRP